jgi:hypothetical protein
MSTKVNKKKKDELNKINEEFNKLFDENNYDDSYKFNQVVETIEDYRNETMKLIDDLYQSVSLDMLNYNNILYSKNSDVSMMKKMFTLGQVDILSRLSTEQQLRRL